jgi:D-galactarolactone isomerase
MTMTAPRLQAPENSCDTHMHFYDRKYPLAPTAILQPPDEGSVATYRTVLRRLGVRRAVVVQPTA